jgi:plastocyanin
MIYRLSIGLACIFGSISGCCMHQAATCQPVSGVSLMQPMASTAPMSTYSANYGAQAGTTYSAQYGTQGGAAASVTVSAYDDYFQPATITVAPGTTVRWINYGRHTHTVMSNDGRWNSGDIQPGASYAATFTQPGTYSYHCCHHRPEMQGTVIVSPVGTAPSGQMSGY